MESKPKTHSSSPSYDPSCHTIAEITRLNSTERELLEITHRMLAAIHAGDIETYRSLSAPDLSCYETDVAPFRIDVLEFHLDLMTAMRERGVYNTLTRFDVLTPRVQVYGDTGIVTYTRLMTYCTESGPTWRAFNETRVFSKIEGQWKMVHFHRSHAA
jgi:calcium/calmodulin-dependent protein kinase (CaM kinase) II